LKIRSRRKALARAQPASVIVVTRSTEQAVEQSARPRGCDPRCVVVIVVQVAWPHALHGGTHLLASGLLLLTAFGELLAALFTTLRAFLTPLLLPVAGLIAA
jgi:hypothetical protein